MAAQRRYVVGFMFCDAGNSIVLIRKNRPAWQAGKLNGVGGKIEVNELPAYAMAREFIEETGVQTAPEEWTHILTMRLANEADKGLVGDAEVLIFMAYWTRIGRGEFPPVKNMTDEEVCILPAGAAPAFDTVPNLRWLINVCRFADIAKPFDMEMAS